MLAIGRARRRGPARQPWPDEPEGPDIRNAHPGDCLPALVFDRPDIDSKSRQASYRSLEVGHLDEWRLVLILRLQVFVEIWKDRWKADQSRVCRDFDQLEASRIREDILADEPAPPRPMPRDRSMRGPARSRHHVARRRGSRPELSARMETDPLRPSDAQRSAELGQSADPVRAAIACHGSPGYAARIVASKVAAIVRVAAVSRMMRRRPIAGTSPSTPNGQATADGRASDFACDQRRSCSSRWSPDWTSTAMSCRALTSTSTRSIQPRTGCRTPTSGNVRQRPPRARSSPSPIRA